MDHIYIDKQSGKDLMGTFLADIVLQILSFVAQNERENIRKRQSVGIKAAKARGVHFSRSLKNPPDNFGELVKQWERGKLATDDILHETGLKQATFYNRLREYRMRRKNKGYKHVCL